MCCFSKYMIQGCNKAVNMIISSLYMQISVDEMNEPWIIIVIPSVHAYYSMSELQYKIDVATSLYWYNCVN